MNVCVGGVVVWVDGENLGVGFVNGCGMVKIELGGGIGFEGYLFGMVWYFINEVDVFILEREGYG